MLRVRGYHPFPLEESGHEQTAGGVWICSCTELPSFGVLYEVMKSHEINRNELESRPA